MEYHSGDILKTTFFKNISTGNVGEYDHDTSHPLLCMPMFKGHTFEDIWKDI